MRDVETVVVHLRLTAMVDWFSDNALSLPSVYVVYTLPSAATNMPPWLSEPDCLYVTLRIGSFSGPQKSSPPAR